MGYILMNSSVLFIFVAVARHLQRLHKGGRSILANSPGGYSLLQWVQPWHPFGSLEKVTLWGQTRNRRNWLQPSKIHTNNSLARPPNTVPPAGGHTFRHISPCGTIVWSQLENIIRRKSLSISTPNLPNTELSYTRHCRLSFLLLEDGAHCCCLLLQDSIVSHTIDTVGSQNAKPKVWFLLNVDYFCIIVKSTNPKSRCFTPRTICVLKGDSKM